MNTPTTTPLQELQTGQAQWQQEMRIPIRQVQVPEGRIGADRYEEGDFLDLVASILTNGLLSPIVVGRGWKLISGLNRLRAYRHITDELHIPGYDTIPARTVITDAHTEVRIEADENLMRQQLGPADAMAMIAAHEASGLSYRAARDLVSTQTGWSKTALNDAKIAEKRLEQDIEAAYETGDAVLIAAAKQSSAALASAPTKTQGVKEARAIMDAAQEQVAPQPAPATPAAQPEQRAGDGGATVTDISSRARQGSEHTAEIEADTAAGDREADGEPFPLPAPAPQPTIGEKQWARIFHVLAPEAGAMGDLDVTEGAAVFASLSAEYQEQVLRVVEMVSRAAGPVEVAA